jgi:DNA-binding beta-propeller fold protein YncE
MKRFVSLSSTVFALLTATLASAQGIFPLFPPMVSTVPSNGDVNPYGVAIVPKTLPPGSGIQPGDILVSNFNNNQNLQGTGTTIVRVTASGNVTTFFTSQRVGLTAALGILSNGWVLIGNLPTADGTSATVGAGSLQVLDRNGNALGTLGNAASIDGPWGMAVLDEGTGGSGIAHVFVSNVLSGTITRFDIIYTPNNLSSNIVQLAAGFNHRTDPAALVLGPSGLAFDAAHNRLLVASSVDNAVYEIDGAATVRSEQAATLLFNNTTALHGPLDIALLPNGNLVIANSDGSNVDPDQPSELTEFTGAGIFVDQMPIDPNNGGAFGLAIHNFGFGAFQLAAVDDNTNTLHIWTSVIQ